MNQLVIPITASNSNQLDCMHKEQGIFYKNSSVFGQIGNL